MVNKSLRMEPPFNQDKKYLLARGYKSRGTIKNYPQSKTTCLEVKQNNFSVFFIFGFTWFIVETENYHGMEYKYKIITSTSYKRMQP